MRNFATSPHIQIMVVTVGAINKKDVNNLYKDSEKTGGEKPIDLIRATRPILIVDEPQSVDGGLEGGARRRSDAMNPLCTLRYSATHADKHHMVYRLDAVDAYERKLVKQIEVASADVEGGHNKPYVRLLSVSNKRGVITRQGRAGRADSAPACSRKEVTVQDGDDLEQTTEPGDLHGLPHRRDSRRQGQRVHGAARARRRALPQARQAIGDVDDDWPCKREMIRRTIKEHLDKEKRLRPQGIKVLSLFFIDAVEQYRQYDADGNPVKGDYALIFEEEYRRLAKHPDYQTLFKEVDLTTRRRGGPQRLLLHRQEEGRRTRPSRVFKDTRGDTKADDDTYNLIMRDKEKLLSFETPLKFIFSHSALREGWDNPNVFQICALRDMGTERERRQTIGRGLRLCVNQNGERLRGFEINTLTVIATESYEQFAENLQKEIEDDTGIRFGIVEAHQFAGITVTGADGQDRAAGLRAVESAMGAPQGRRATSTPRARCRTRCARRSRTAHLTLPEPVRSPAAAGHGNPAQAGRQAGNQERRRAQAGQDPAGRAAQRGVQGAVGPHQAQDHLPRAVRQREADRDCTKALRDAPPIAKTRLQWRKADLAIGKAGVEATETAIGRDRSCWKRPTSNCPTC